MSDVLAIVEQREGHVRGVSSEVVSVAAQVARETGGTAHALMIGGPGMSAAGAEMGRFGAEKILAVENEALLAYHPQGYAQVVTEAVRAGVYGSVVFAKKIDGPGGSFQAVGQGFGLKLFLTDN